MASTSRYEKRDRVRPHATVEELYKKAQSSYAFAGGFIREETDKSDDEELSVKFRKAEKLYDESAVSLSPSKDDDDVEGSFCIDCGRPFSDSFLSETFDHMVCDECKDLDERHELITRTDAKVEYLLKDCDFNVRQPQLKFISKKNPHNPRWGDMRLYLKLQVEKRAIEIHGSLETLEAKKEIREDKRTVQKQRRFHKKIVELRKTVRSDLYRITKETHVHDFGEEQYDSKEDKYYRQCNSCNHMDVYEKL